MTSTIKKPHLSTSADIRHLHILMETRREEFIDLANRSLHRDVKRKLGITKRHHANRQENVDTLMSELFRWETDADCASDPVVLMKVVVRFDERVIIRRRVLPWYRRYSRLGRAWRRYKKALRADTSIALREVALAMLERGTFSPA